MKSNTDYHEQQFDKVDYFIYESTDNSLSLSFFLNLTKRAICCHSPPPTNTNRISHSASNDTKRINHDRWNLLKMKNIKQHSFAALGKNYRLSHVVSNFTLSSRALSTSEQTPLWRARKREIKSVDRTNEHVIMALHNSPIILSAAFRFSIARVCVCVQCTVHSIL